VLVATDIAARGIDVEELSHVVNFDVPSQPDDYIHRVGRTARVERTGDAFTFVSPAEESNMRVIEKAIGGPLPRMRIAGFEERQQSRPEVRRASPGVRHTRQRRVGAGRRGRA